MSLFTVNPEKCKRDDICVFECPALVIERNGGDSVPTPTAGADEECIGCGHCVTVCPHGAFEHRELHPDNCLPVEKGQYVGPEQLEHFLRARRSIRTYKEKSVEREKLAKLIDIARFAPTGSNKQTPEWRVVESPGKVQVLSDMVIDWMQSVIVKKPDMAAELDLQELVDIRDSGYDIICRKAPHAIIVHAPKQTGTPTEDGIIAMTYLELAAFSFGLGACWAGYLNFAINKWPPLKKVLSIPEDHVSVGAILLGHPKFKYHRLPLRNDPKIAWI